MTVCPGCATATEAFTAARRGRTIAFKIFPSSAFALTTSKALKAALPAGGAGLYRGRRDAGEHRPVDKAWLCGRWLGSDLHRAGPARRTVPHGRRQHLLKRIETQ